MKITALGTNGWFDTNTGLTNCTIVETDKFTLILDAGFGMTRIKQLIDFSKPAYLFLTHLHLDHTIGLHTLNYYSFAHPLRIVAPLGGVHDLKQLLRTPFTSDWDKIPYSIEIYPAEEASSFHFPFHVEALPLIHAVPDTGYRFVIDDKVIAFVLDTGECENAVTLARDADLLITECGFPPEIAEGPSGHLNPTTAAKLAMTAGAKQTLLIHFGANVYPTLESRLQAIEPARAIYPMLIAGVDFLEIML